ncbi:MAG TPA: phosphatase PAP2 family protein [Candidatus Acidoferrales bacterium]|nr:phosphatase PAP2 family protein [Candidatus Acidoferrales bacterium]
MRQIRTLFAAPQLLFLVILCAFATNAQQLVMPRTATFSFSPVREADYSSSRPIPPASESLVNGDVSWKTLPWNILRDEKYVFYSYPVSLGHGQHLLPTFAVVGTTAGLIAADPPAMRYFGRTTDFNRFDETFNGAFTGAMEAAFPASLYIFGVVTHDNYAAKTALLAGEAYADSAIPHVLIKVVSRRIRPNAMPPGTDYTHSFFRSSVTPFGRGSSFPSGHAAGAFSIATVIARRYRDHKWVPWMAYGIATVFSFSRAPDRAHYPSDIFVGAALGYVITRYVTLREQE